LRKTLQNWQPAPANIEMLDTASEKVSETGVGTASRTKLVPLRPSPMA
jgi:hypothetical protein